MVLAKIEPGQSTASLFITFNDICVTLMMTKQQLIFEHLYHSWCVLC